MDSLIPFTTSGALMDCVDSTSTYPQCLHIPSTYPEPLSFFLSTNNNSNNSSHISLHLRIWILAFKWLREDVGRFTRRSKTTWCFEIVWSIRYVPLSLSFSHQIHDFFLVLALGGLFSQPRSGRHSGTYISRNQLCWKLARFISHQRGKCRVIGWNRTLFPSRSLLHTSHFSSSCFFNMMMDW